MKKGIRITWPERLFLRALIWKFSNGLMNGLSIEEGPEKVLVTLTEIRNLYAKIGGKKLVKEMRQNEDVFGRKKECENQ